MSTDSDPKEPSPFPTSENHGGKPPSPASPKPSKPTDEELDHGIEESFPASDPVSVNVTRIDEKKP